MKLSQLPYGAITTIDLTSPDDGFSTGAVVGDEITLLTSAQSGVVMLRAGESAWRVAGAEPAHQDALDLVMDTNLPRIAWVTNAAKGSPLTVRVHRFAQAVSWDDKLIIEVDDESLRSLTRARSGKMTMKRALAWLEAEFLLPHADRSSRRLFASAGPSHAVAAGGGGFSLYGKSTIAHIDKQGDRFRVKTVRRAAAKSSHNVALTVVEAEVAFDDARFTTTFRTEHSAAFQELLSSGRQYLNYWDDYSKREREQILSRALGLGFARYTKIKKIDKSTYRFHLEPQDGIDFFGRLGEGRIELEAAAEPPEDLLRGALEIQGRGPDVGFTGTIVRINPAAHTVELRAPEWHEDPSPPAEQGSIFLSLLGDRQRLKRQVRARERIVGMRTPMPHLGPLLEGRPVQAPRRGSREIRPRELAAFAQYAGRFTDKQEEAVRIALNTPDIALIQGPPGTGKTSVITAIEECLVELGKKAGDVGHSVLLTSFQHEAVDEVARRTQVLGLPAVKVSSRRRKEDDRQVREWCERMTTALRADRSPTGELMQAVRQVESLVIGYGKQPPSPPRTREMLEQIDRLVGDRLPIVLRSRLVAARDNLMTEPQVSRPDAENLEPLRRAISGLRVHPAAFTDDGPHMARKALLRLTAYGHLSAAEVRLLEAAADWEGDSVPPFLDRLVVLRDRLLDLTAPMAAPIPTTIDDELMELLDDVVRTLRHVLSTSGEGAAAAIEHFLEELEYDTEAIAGAIRDFTAVLAATCQQSSSKAMADEIRDTGDGIMFDTVIVDEAARANPLDLMIPLCLSRRRIILVGDHRQLPHLLEPDIEKDLESSAEAETLEALRQSMFERLFHYLRTARADSGLSRREITLDQQFRMHPVLGSFVSDAFYSDDTAIDNGPDTENLRHGIERYGDAVAVWADISRERSGPEISGRSKSRAAEADWIADELKRLVTETSPDVEFGVITFYRAQVNLIWAALHGVGLATQMPSGEYQPVEKLVGRLHVGTVDAFQGREFDVVLLSVTRSNDLPGGQPRANRAKYGHLLLTNRLCVAMSRQKRLLIVAGDAAMFSPEKTGGEVRGLVEFKTLCEGEHGRVLRV
ncbi:AAA domain-containing protein [Nonomuraea sp. NPDC048901]|uniref:DEAD/DEAH box helicase n=1 Tax=Nonomuraea sp. NPDC048901 TaxID=3155627 RepID=UPI0033E58359